MLARAKENKIRPAKAAGAGNAGLARPSFLQRVKKDVMKHPMVYFMLLPVVAYYLIFAYVPMYGIVSAFQDYTPSRGYFGSEWVGFKHFQDFFGSFYFERTLTNTLRISIKSLIISFPMSIIFALLINEVRSKYFVKTVQTMSYMPHFVSMVVICGLVKNFVGQDGALTDLIVMLGGERRDLLMDPAMFDPIYIGSGIWSGIGWGSIIYIAALAGIDMELYEAAKLDGANRFQSMLHVTLPGILPTISIMFILAVGGIMNVGYEKIILLYNPGIWETADVISSFTYRKGIIQGNFSYGTAVGLFNQVINFFLLFVTNKISRKLGETSLW